MGFDQVGDPVSEHPGFSGPRTRYDHAWPLGIDNAFFLGFVQFIQIIQHRQNCLMQFKNWLVNSMGFLSINFFQTVN